MSEPMIAKWMDGRATDNELLLDVFANGIKSSIGALSVIRDTIIKHGRFGQPNDFDAGWNAALTNTIGLIESVVEELRGVLDSKTTE